MEDLKLFRSIISKYKNIKIYSEQSIERLYSMKIILNVNEEEIEVTNEDKDLLLNYLKENFIPISNDTFIDVCKKYYKGLLFSKNK